MIGFGDGVCAYFNHSALDSLLSPAALPVVSSSYSPSQSQLLFGLPQAAVEVRHED
ncbi:TPA: hypothetical protein PXN48_004163 [Yersinia enterocolitica]|nr:hypothetical protein [Yersinia enterocolitica]